VEKDRVFQGAKKGNSFVAQGEASLQAKPNPGGGKKTPNPRVFKRLKSTEIVRGEGSWGQQRKTRGNRSAKTTAREVSSLFVSAEKGHTLPMMIENRRVVRWKNSLDNWLKKQGEREAR